MIAGDKIFRNLVIDAFPVFEDILPISLALLVIVIGQFWKAKGSEETNASDCR
jgi:hypothetical protein